MRALRLVLPALVALLAHLALESGRDGPGPASPDAWPAAVRRPPTAIAARSDALVRRIEDADRALVGARRAIEDQYGIEHGPVEGAARREAALADAPEFLVEQLELAGARRERLLDELAALHGLPLASFAPAALASEARAEAFHARMAIVWPCVAAGLAGLAGLATARSGRARLGALTASAAGLIAMQTWRQLPDATAFDAWVSAAAPPVLLAAAGVLARLRRTDAGAQREA